MRLADVLQSSRYGARPLALALGVTVLTFIGVLAAGGSLPLAVTSAIVALGLVLACVRFHAATIAGAVELGRQLATFDAATDLPGPGYADHFVATEFAAAQRGRAITIVLLHFDRFDDFTRVHGPAAADHAVREFGSILKRLTRRMNHSARYGWRLDAFLSVLSEADAAAALVFVQRVREAVGESARTAPMPTLSVGLAEFRPDFTTPAEFLEAAERALGEARADGGNCVRYARPRQPAEGDAARPVNGSAPRPARWAPDAGRQSAGAIVANRDTTPGVPGRARRRNNSLHNDF